MSATTQELRRAQDLVRAAEDMVLSASGATGWAGRASTAYTEYAGRVARAIGRAADALGMLAGFTGSAPALGLADATRLAGSAEQAAATVAANVPMWAAMSSALFSTSGRGPDIFATQTGRAGGTDPGVNPGHLAKLDSTFTDVDSTGLISITFPLTVTEDESDQMFFANEVYFQGDPSQKKETAYIGLMGNSGPIPGARPGAVRFGVFGDDTSAVGGNNVGKPDRTAGTSDVLYYGWNLGDEYALSLTVAPGVTGRETLIAQVLDKTTGVSSEVGQVSVPASWGALSSRTVGFVEHPDPVPSLSQLGHTTATFGPPTGVDSNGAKQTATIEQAAPSAYPANDPATLATADERYPNHAPYVDASGAAHVTKDDSGASVSISPDYLPAG